MLSPLGGAEFAVTTVGKIWTFDVASGKLLQRIGREYEWAEDLSYTPDGKLILTCDSKGSIHVRDATNGKTVRSIAAGTEMIEGIAVSPDGKTVASGSWDKSVRIWDIASGKEMQTFLGLEDWVTSVLFSKDGKLLVSGDQGTNITVWDVASGKRLHQVNGLVGRAIKSMAFMPPSNAGSVTTVIAGNLKSLVVLSPDNGRWSQGKVKSAISALAVSPDGNFIVLGLADKSISVLDQKNKKQFALAGK